MNRLRVVIVDDEEPALEGLEFVLSQDPEVEIVGTAADGESAVASIRALRPDLVLLDVRMPRFDGFEVLRRLQAEERPAVIFVTAYDQYAIRAFEQAAVDYLLKPFSDERLRQSVARVKQTFRRGEISSLGLRVEELLQVARRLAGEGPASPPAAAPAAPGGAPEPASIAPDDRLLLKTGSDLNVVKLGEIVWIEAEGDYVKVHRGGRPHLVRMPLRQLEQRLQARGFARIHRSALINLAHVVSVTPGLYGDYQVQLSDGAKLRLSRSFAKSVRHLLPPRLS